MSLENAIKHREDQLKRMEAKKKAYADDKEYVTSCDKYIKIIKEEIKNLKKEKSKIKSKIKDPLDEINDEDGD
jgi:chromosome segregation ATPase